MYSEKDLPKFQRDPKDDLERMLFIEAELIKEFETAKPERARTIQEILNNIIEVKSILVREIAGEV